MSKTSTVLSSTSILGMALTVVLDLIEPFFGGFQVAAICSLSLLGIGLIVWALPPLNGYLLSTQRSPEFRELVMKFWPKPFFISNLLLLIILLAMLQLNNMYSDSGGFTRTALASLNVIEADVAEIRKNTTKQLEVTKQLAATSVDQLTLSKKQAKTAAFNQKNRIYHSMLQYIRNGYSTAELETLFPTRSADVATNLIVLLDKVLSLYSPAEQIIALEYFHEMGYFDHKEAFTYQRSQGPMFEDNMAIPTELSIRAKHFTKAVKSVLQLQQTLDYAPRAIKSHQDQIAWFKKKYADSAGDYIEELEGKIAALNSFLGIRNELSDVMIAVDRLPLAARVRTLDRLQQWPFLSVTADPLGFARAKDATEAESWFMENTDFSGDTITSVDSQGTVAIYSLPDWRLKNTDAFFWAKVTNEKHPDVAQLNRLEADIQALDIEGLMAAYPGL